jgi:RNA polymerase sigma-70 factor (ECF subfamily)
MRLRGCAALETGRELVVEQRADKSLVRRILADDQEACVYLVREHHAPIYRFLVHLCRDAHRAEDLTQETFAAAWAGIGGFGGTSSLRTWLYQIAYRKFLDAQRRRVVADNAAITNGVEHVDRGSADPMEAAMASEDVRQLYDAIGQLTADERDVVVMHYLQGMKYEEIAEVLAVPAGTLRWRKSRALESLRRMMDEKVEHGVE